MILALKSQGWVFTYIGANHDVEKTAVSLNINNHLHFEAVFYNQFDSEWDYESFRKTKKRFEGKVD